MTVVDISAEPKHHPTICSTRRYGCWVECCCGWRSEWSYTSVTGAHLAFGEHLVKAAS